MNHDHEGCRHDLRFCYQCDVAYCGKCDVNWSQHQATWFGPNNTVTCDTGYWPEPTTTTGASAIPVNHAAHGSAA